MKAKRFSLHDPDYFEDYAGTGKHYDLVWSRHTRVNELIKFWKEHDLPSVKTALVLGAATGRVATRIEEKLGAKCWGCEINTWAYRRMPTSIRRRFKNLDMRDYIKQPLKEHKTYDLIFSNSLIYLPKRDIDPFLKALSRVGRVVHFYSSFLGNACRDPYRLILEKYEWWNRRFKKAGFRELRFSRVRRSYLWESKNIRKAT